MPKVPLTVVFDFTRHSGSMICSVCNEPERDKDMQCISPDQSVVVVGAAFSAGFVSR